LSQAAQPVKVVEFKLQLTQLAPTAEGVNELDLHAEQTFASEQTAHSLSGQTIHFLLAMSL